MSTSNFGHDPFDTTVGAGQPSFGPQPAGRRRAQAPRDPRDPIVQAQNERLRLLRVAGRANPAAADDMPPLPRVGRGGALYFSAVGLRDVARRVVAKPDIVEGYKDASYMLSATYRPGVEQVALTMWARHLAGGDVSPMFSPRQVYRPEDLCLVRIGFTGETLHDPEKGDMGPQAVAVLYTVTVRDGVPTATPSRVYDLTARTRLTQTNVDRFLAIDLPILAGLVSYGAYNLCDTLRRWSDPAHACFGNAVTSAHGPLAVVTVDGDERGPDGAPLEATQVVWSLTPGYGRGSVPSIRDADADVMLSFAHLGPVVFDRGLPPVVGMTPWTVSAGGVYSYGQRYGDVAVGNWPT